MVSIVTGKINSGKTSKIIALYKQTKKGDGFVSLKKMDKNIVLGYDAMQLSTGKTFPIVIREDLISPDFKCACQIGPYLFDKEAIEKIKETFDILISKRIEPLYLDEIGPLELEGKAFDNILKSMLISGLDLYITVRTGLIEQVIDRYKITEYETI